jgi:hypothetical protein
MKTTGTPPYEEYQTSDLYLASYLKARGMRIVDTLRDGRRTTFVFSDQTDRRDLVRSFYDDGTVRVCDYKNALNDLRAMIYNT